MGDCMGYELMADLTFPVATGTYNPWAPIGPFNTTFAGNGHTLAGMRVNVSVGHAGLFSSLGGGGVIRDAGIINANVTTTDAGRRRNRRGAGGAD